MNDPSWLNDFDETCQAIREDAVLIQALAVYVCSKENNPAFPQALLRISDYLSQHAWDLHNLKKRLEPDLPMKPGP